jgi:hypothetical protein
LKKKYKILQAPVDREVDSICYSNVVEISSNDPKEELSSFTLLDEESWSKEDFDNSEFSANLSAIEILNDEEIEENEEQFNVLDEPLCYSFYSDQLYFLYE